MPPTAPGQGGAHAKAVVAGADAAKAAAGGGLPLKAARPRQPGRAAVLGAVGNPQMIKNALTRLCLPGELHLGCSKPL